MKLYDVKAVAGFLDISERRVRQLRAEGVISEYEGFPSKYDLKPTVHKYINYLRQRNPDSEEKLDYHTERAKLVRAKRQKEEAELGILQDDLHSSAEVEAELSKILVAFKNRLLSIPAKLAQQISAKTDKSEIFRIIKESIDEALNELSDFDSLFNKGESGNDKNSD